MAKIVSITSSPSSKIDALIERDRHLMEAVNQWHIAKAKCDLFWAEEPQEPIDYKAECERISELFGTAHGALDVLAYDDSNPSTAQAANAMLKVALELMAIRMIDPNSTFSRGPVFEIVRNVRNGLGDLDFEAVWSERLPGSAA